MGAAVCKCLRQPTAVDKALAAHKTKLKALFTSIDRDKSGMISPEELTKKLSKDKEVQVRAAQHTHVACRNRFEPHRTPTWPVAATELYCAASVWLTP